MNIGTILLLVGGLGAVGFFILQRQRQMMGIGDETDPGFIGPPSNLATIVGLTEPVTGASLSLAKGPNDDKTLPSLV